MKLTLLALAIAALAHAAPIHQEGPGYKVDTQSLQGSTSSAGDPTDRLLWIRGGSGRISIGNPARVSQIATGDLVRIPHSTPYAIAPAGSLEFLSVRIAPL